MVAAGCRERQFLPEGGLGWDFPKVFGISGDSDWTSIAGGDRERYISYVNCLPERDAARFHSPLCSGLSENLPDVVKICRISTAVFSADEPVVKRLFDDQPQQA